MAHSTSIILPLNKLTLADAPNLLDLPVASGNCLLLTQLLPSIEFLWTTAPCWVACRARRCLWDGCWTGTHRAVRSWPI